MVAIKITRSDLDARQLREASATAANARVARRMLAIALVLEGVDRKTAAETCGMDRQTLRDWIHRYNAAGVAGLLNRSPPGPRRRLSPEQLAELSALLEDAEGTSRQRGAWRAAEIRFLIRQRFGIDYHERTAAKILAHLRRTTPAID